VLLDYVDTMTRLPKLLEQVVAENEDAETMIDGAQTAAIDELAKRIPKTIGLLPDIFFRSRTTDDRHPAAVEEMTKDLLKLAERANPDLLVSIEVKKFVEHWVSRLYLHDDSFASNVVSSSTTNAWDVGWGS
jgi:nuclear pore complex protein Nup98-Nup96